MTTSELIKKLQILQKKYGDSELRFIANDYYTRCGLEMDLRLLVGETNGMPSDYFGFTHNKDANMTTISFSLNQDSEGKLPKITYRKK